MNGCTWLSAIDPEATEWWGVELSDLARLTHTTAPVLPSFVVARTVYRDFFEVPALKKAIQKATKGLSVDKPAGFSTAAKAARQAILSANFPGEIQKDLQAYYEEFRSHLLYTSKKALSLRIRLVRADGTAQPIQISSATAQAFMKGCKQAYALQFSDELLYQRYSQNLSIIGQAEPLLVQYYPEPEYSGLVSAQDAQTHDDTVANLQVQVGEYHPDGGTTTYRVDLKSQTVLSVEQAYASWKKESTGALCKRTHQALLDEKQVLSLAALAKRAQESFSNIYSFQWLQVGAQFWLSGAIPLTAKAPNQEATSLLQGVSAHYGHITGRVHLVHAKHDQATMRQGDIAVVKSLHPKDIHWLAFAGGIIAEQGTKTGIEAKIAAELNIPAVVGVRAALHTLQPGQVITLDAVSGQITSGKTSQPTQLVTSSVVTGTHILATVGDPLSVQEGELASTDGIGLLRSEFILELLGKHPAEIIKQGQHQDYIQTLAAEVGRLVKAAAPHPVIYQFHDPLDVPLHAGRHGSSRKEPNPLLGYRGAHRLLQEPELLELELAALNQLAAEGLTNLHVLLPTARNLDEIAKLQERLLSHTLAQNLRLHIWAKCDTPAVAILAEHLPELGLTGIVVDVLGLAQLVTGVDGINRQMAAHLQQADPAVLQAMEYVIRTMRQQGLHSIVLAEGASVDPEVVERAVQSGVSGLSVPLAEVKGTRHMVAVTEQRMLLDHLLEEPLSEEGA